MIREQGTPSVAAGAGSSQDRLMKRRLGWPSMAALCFSNIVGSAWLFSAYYAARTAGPVALFSWLLCAAAMAFVAVTFIELGITRPVGGGNVRWPFAVCGPFVGVMIGWVVFLQACIALPGEASAILQYSSRWFPVLFAHAHLTTTGVLVGIGILGLLTLFNWFGVQLLARVTNALAVFKVAVPFMTGGLLLASGFAPGNVTAGGGMAPYGTSAMLTALTGAGLVYAFGGLQAPSMMAGEAKNPRRDIPIGTFLGFGVAFLLYLLLQSSYLFSVPHALLAAHGWHGIDLESPFAQLAALLNIGWLADLLMVDAVVSPLGGAFVATGYFSRNTYGLGQTGTFPAWVGLVHARSGIPRHALLLNFCAAVVLLVVFKSWRGLATALSMFFALGYVVMAATAAANRFDHRLHVRGLAPWLVRGAAPVAFVASGLIMFWAGWSHVRTALILFAFSLPLYGWLVLRRGNGAVFTLRGTRYGAWLLVYVLVIGLLSWLGSYGDGRDWIPAPWDSLAAALVSIACYLWALRSSRRWLSCKRRPPGPAVDAGR